MDLRQIPLFSMITRQMDWLTTRQKVLAQNVANADTPNYQAKDIAPLDFGAMARAAGNKLNLNTTSGGHIRSGMPKAMPQTPKKTPTEVNKVQFDQSAFTRRYEPSHPGANAEGYVQQPNVTVLIESMDMREAQRTYEANLSMISTARAMLMRTIGIIN